jgi:hypothetical protein
LVFIGFPQQNQNIKVDIWHPDLGLRCRISPTHLSQLATDQMYFPGL